MFAGRTYEIRWSTPADEIKPGYLEGIIARLFHETRGPVVLSAYNFSLPEAWEGMSSVIDRGVPVLGVLDHTQWSGPSCQKFAAGHIEKYRGWWMNQWVVVGTTKAGQIEHKKVIVVNAPILGYTVPDGDFDSLDAALEAGYPITWDGSYNFSVPAVKQANTITLTPSKIIAADAATQILQERLGIIERDQRYQPYPLPDGAKPRMMDVTKQL